MKKSIFTKLIVTVIAAVLFCGCQMPCRPCQEKRINKTMAEWKTALKTKNMEKVMAAYSENYASERIEGKGAIREFMTRVFNEGWMENVTVSFEEVTTTIEEDKAQFGPVAFISDNGTLKVDYKLQKENGDWLIVSSKMQEQ